jgi:competence protein ComEC
MVNKLSPVFFCSAGCALAFYSLSFYPFPLVLMLICLLAVCGMEIAVRRTEKAKFWLKARIPVLVFAAGLAIGAGGRAASRTPGNFPLREISAIEGTILEDPRFYPGSAKNTYRGAASMVGASAFYSPDGVKVSTPGKALPVKVYFPEESVTRLREFGRGCKVSADGSISKGTFRAKTFHVSEPPPKIERLRTAFRLKVVENFSTQSWGALGSALFLGVRDDLDGQIRDAYRDAGCSHVLALSGMHLGLISLILAFLLKPLLGKKAASAAGALAIFVYVFLAGAQPSLVRAGIMYILGSIAVCAGIPGNSLSLLSASFIVQLFIDPSSLLEVSSILSYLSLAGILLVTPICVDILRGLVPGFLAQSLSASIGAFIATLIPSALIFGVLRPVGILASLAVIPAITVFMVGALLFAVLFPIMPSLAGVLGEGMGRLYRLMNWVVSLAAKVPGVPLPGLAAAAFSFALCMGALLAVYFPLKKRRNLLVPFA